MNTNPQRRRSIARLLLAAVVGTLGLTTFGSTASAFEIQVAPTVARECGADAPWSATITMSSADYGSEWSTSYEIVGGASSGPSARQRDIVPFFYDLGTFPASTESITVNMSATWFNGLGQVGSGRTLVIQRPATTECPTTTPTAPTVSYDCVNDVVAIVGADDTATVDYTVTVVTPPAGEGTPWSITVTAAPQPGAQFPPGVTTTWNFSGVVDCLTPTTPAAPTVTYGCVTDALVITGATDTASVDYTVAVVTAPAGEGSPWAVTVTAAPQPGFEFPPNTTTTWNFSGTVNCLGPVTPTAPAVTYSCVTDALAITGATDTASVDYTVAVVTAPAGEGSPWAVTVTAAPQPGFQFPPNVTTTWNFSGVVDCLTPTTPAVPTVIYSCVADTLTVVGADDTASVDYTVTLVTAPAGEGSTWAVTVTAAPQAGFEFPPNTTTTWNFSGTVNCDQPVIPTAPTAAYDCTSSTVTVSGAVDTASIDYTVTVVTPPAGEGSAWAISVTAVPLPGFEFPAGTTATWSFSGVVDCDDSVDPPTTTSTTTTLPPGATTTTTTVPSTPTTTSNESGAGATTTQPSGRLPVTGSSTSMLFSWATVVTALGGIMVLLVRRPPRRRGA